MSDTASSVSTEVIDNVLVVHLDDGRANALSLAAIRTLGAVMDHAEADDTIGAVVVHGRPGRFSAGFDLTVIRSGDPDAVVELLCAGGELVRRLYGSPVPVVAACTGHAIAAGALLLLGSDVRIGADIDCKIGLNEVAIGMILPRWAITIAQERLSRRHLQVSVTGARLFDGRGAVDAGYLDEAVPADSVLATALERAKELAALNGRAYAGTVLGLRGEVLDRMAAFIAADREAGLSALV